MIAAPAPRPSDEELLDAIGHLTLRELAWLRYRLLLLLVGRIARDAGL